MSKYALHIGVNEVNREEYGSGFPQLHGCINDAHQLQSLVAGRGFESRPPLLDKQATSHAVKDELKQLADVAVSGDLVMVTYSGHGSRMPGGPDEEDGQDETWVLADRQLIDDELWWAWSEFRPGTRLLVISDSCHSGTVSRVSPVVAPDLDPVTPPGVTSRLLNLFQRRRDFERRHQLYERIRRETPDPDDVEVGASVLLMAACQDGQTAGESEARGIFTTALVAAFGRTPPPASYRELFQVARRGVVDRYPRQTPNFLPLGREDLEFEACNPLD